MKAVRQRVGIGLAEDGWHVFVEFDGKAEQVEGVYATEAEAEVASRDLSRRLREVWKSHGIGWIDNPL